MRRESRTYRFGLLGKAGYLRRNVVSILLLIILLVILIGVLPTWPYSSGWGYYPSGGLGIVVIIVLVLWLVGYL